MKNYILKLCFFSILFYIGGGVLPASGQTSIVINGMDQVCRGVIEVYAPQISDGSYNYEWSITPSNMGTILSSNATGTTIHWNGPAGNATIQLAMTDINNQIIYTGQLTVTIGDLPVPFITSDTELACQPLDNDGNQDKPNPPVFDEQNCQLVCAYSNVSYYANGDDGSTFQWVVNGAVGQSTTTGDHCVVDWGSEGFGQVTLIETTEFGCVVETMICVEITASPQAYFQPMGYIEEDIFVACTYTDIIFEDWSDPIGTSPIVSYLWDWGDGHQTLMSPGTAGTMIAHQYENSGDYEVTLTVINACGCSSSYTLSIKIMEAEPIEILCPRVVCEGDKAEYSLPKDLGCHPSHWSVEGGEIVDAQADRVVVIWNDVDPPTGFGKVMYETCGLCKMLVVEPVPVILRTGRIQGPEIICEGTQYVFRMPQWPSTEFDWQIIGPAIIEPTDQRNEIALRATGTGLIELSVLYKNTVLGCIGRAEMNINSLPPAIISGPTVLCTSSMGNFSLNSPHTGDWTLSTFLGVVVATGSGANFNYMFNNAGNYRLKVNGNTFCPPEDYVIKVNPTPNVPDIILGPDRACPAVPTKYEAGILEPGTTFKWSVSGGGTVNSTIGDHTYVTFNTLPAVVIATRVTTDGLACGSDPLHFEVEVPIPPLVIAGPDSVCHSTVTSYSLNYEEGDYYYWELSDPLLGSVVNNVNSASVEVQWNMPLNAGQLVYLIAKVKKCGVETSHTYPVYIKGTPEITFINLLPNDTVCSGTSITLEVNTSTPLISGSFIVNWGDGVSQTYVNPAPITYTYHTTGSSAPVAYTPTVTLMNANGCEGAVTVHAPSITVMPAPTTMLSPTGPLLTCTPVNELLMATVTTGIGGSNSYEWFPGGMGGATFTATDFGSYYVQVSNSVFGCQSTSNIVKVLNNCDPIPPGGDPDPACPPGPIIDLSYTVHCGSIHLVSNYPGGVWTTSSGHIIDLVTLPDGSATATALLAGMHRFNYRVNIGNNCGSTYRIDVVIPYLPDLRYDITCDQENQQYEINLYDHSNEYPEGMITQRSFYRAPSTLIGTGLGTTVSQAPGTTREYYQVIGDGQNPSCTSYVSITTPTFPAVEVFIDPSNEFMPGCVDDVAFQLGHAILGGNIASYYWDFDDDSYNMSSIHPIGKVYDFVALRYPSLTVTDIHGCWARDSVEVEIEENNLEGSISNSGSPVCQGTVVNLSYSVNQSTPLPTHYYWYEQSEQIYAGTSSTHSVTEPGGYWVLGMDSYGCKVSTDITTVEVIQLPPLSIVGPNQVCVDQEFTLSVPDYGPEYMYIWSGSAAGVGASIDLNLSVPGTYTYQVTMIDLSSGLGCMQMTLPITVTVHPPPAPPILDFDVLSCDPYLLELTATGIDGTYNWSNGMTGQIIQTPFGGHYQVTLTDHNGCEVESTITVPKSLEEYMWVFPKGCFCDIKDAYVVGPILPLGWSWWQDGMQVNGGYGVFPPTPIDAEHTFQMGLHNAWCGLMSDPMYYTWNDCYGTESMSGVYPIYIGFESFQERADEMKVMPIPTQDLVQVHYQLIEGATHRQVEVWDITGRVLQRHELLEDQGSLELSLGQYASGLYQVVLKKDGETIQTIKVSLIK